MSEMKKIIILIFFFTSSYSFCNSFLKGIDDIPIYKNMVYVEESLVMFDKVHGRFVSTAIVGEYEYYEVSEFYKKILPNLGWKLVKKDFYQRGKESLELEYKYDGTSLRVIFNVAPKKSE